MFRRKHIKVSMHMLCWRTVIFSQSVSPAPSDANGCGKSTHVHFGIPFASMFGAWQRVCSAVHHGRRSLLR